MGILEGFQFQVDERLDFTVEGNSTYKKTDCGVFFFPSAPAIVPSGTDNLCLLVSQPPAHTVTCALSIQVVPAAARFYPVILHIIPCSSSCTF